LAVIPDSIRDPEGIKIFNSKPGLVMEKLKFDIVKTAWGYVAVAASRQGLRHVVLPRSTKAAAFDALSVRLRGEQLLPDAEHPWLMAIGAKLTEYFSGRAVEFNCKLDYNVATVFQRQVWSVARTIDYGVTRTYGWVAARLGDPDARRAVGQALNANPLPVIVPCHRVTASRGRLGGFTEGAEMKSRLLKLESVILA
jgi:methylated-DNA-[protein]-cysteine S-methyltransferase